MPGIALPRGLLNFRGVGIRNDRICSVAPNPLSVEGFGTHVVAGGLGAIRLQDCVQLCSSIAGLRAITQ